MNKLQDKFGIIKDNLIELQDNDIISNFIENYLESDTFIILPTYFYQLLWKYENYKINIENLIDNYLKDIRKNIRLLIKKGKFDIENLNKLITTYLRKIKKIKSIFISLNESFDGYTEFHNIIISDPTLICFLESEINDGLEIKKLIYNIRNINKNNKTNFIWFLKLISSVLRNKINTNLVLPIPTNYLIIYNFMETINYYQNINTNYNFLDNNLYYITNPIINILIQQISNIISLCSIKQITSLLENKIQYINNIINDDVIKKKLRSEISNCINKYIFYDKIISIQDTYNYLKFIIIANNNNLLESYILLCFNNPKIINNVHEIIHNYIYKENKFIINILNLAINNINNIDIFVDKYHTFLIKRALSNNFNIQLENSCIYQFAKLGEKYIIKISKIIDDKVSSNKDVLSFHKLNTDYTKLSLITTSYSNWNFNYNQGLIDNKIIDENTKSTLCYLLDCYNKHYDTIYENKRKLLWLPQYGEVNIYYEYNDDKYIEIKLLPIQLLVLELFDSNETINLDDIKNNNFFVHYSSNYKDEIIKSLIIGKILTKNNNILKLSRTDNISTDFISIFMNNSSFLENEENNRIEELALDRNDIIASIVNHILKKESKDFTNLLKLVNEKNNIFQVTNDMLINVLSKMINMDYIIYDENTKEYIKIYY